LLGSEENPTLLGTNEITDSSVSGVSARFYQLSNSTCASKVIGFYSLTIPSNGMALVADQLYQVDDDIMRADFPGEIGVPMNTLYSLFGLPTWATDMGGFEISKWNGTAFITQTNENGRGEPPFWQTAGGLGVGDMTMLPGGSEFMSNPQSTPVTIWFTGLVRNQQVFNLPAGTSYLSATAPLTGYVTNVTGYVAHAGDTIKFWSTNSQSYVSHTYTNGAWSNGGSTNTLSIGQGFVLISTNPYTWTNTWQ
jgi:hypothetical protein